MCVCLHSVTLSHQFLVHSADAADTGLQTPACLGKMRVLEESEGKLGIWILKLSSMFLAVSSFWEMHCEASASKISVIPVKNHGNNYCN